MINRRRFLAGLSLGLGGCCLRGLARAGGDAFAAQPVTWPGGTPAEPLFNTFGPPVAPFLRLWAGRTRSGEAIPGWSNRRLDNTLTRSRYGYVSGSRSARWPGEVSADLYLHQPSDAGVTVVVTNDLPVPRGAAAFRWQADGWCAAGAADLFPVLKLRMAVVVIGRGTSRVLLDDTGIWIGGEHRISPAWRGGRDHEVSPGETVRLAWAATVNRNQPDVAEFGTFWVGCRPAFRS